MSGAVSTLSWSSDGQFDEVVATGHLHGERMDDDHYWMSVGSGEVTLNFWIKRRWFRRPTLEVQVDDYRAPAADRKPKEE